MTFPIKQVSESEVFLVGSRSSAGVITNVAAAAAGAFTATTVVSVEKWRRMTVFLASDAVAATASGRLGIRAWGSAAMVAGAQPTVAMDAWYALPAWDGSVTSTAVAGAPGVGGGTAPPGQGLVQLANGLWSHPAWLNATDKWRGCLRFDVSDLRWVVFEYAEVGDTAHPSKAAISYTFAL